MSHRYPCIRAGIIIVMSAICHVVLAMPTASIDLMPRWRGEAPTLQLSGVQRAWIAEHHGVVRVGVLANEAVPLDIIDATGHYQGISAEYLSIFKSALRVQLAVVPFADRASLMKALTKGDIDLATAVQRSSEWKDVIYSPPYFGNKRVLARRNDNPSFSIRSAGHDPVLAYVRSTVDEAALREQYSDMRLLALPSLSAALDAVAFGEADASVGNATALNYMIERRQLLDVSVTDAASVVTEDFSFAASADNDRLVQMLGSVLERIPSGERAIIRTLYEGFGAHYTIAGEISLSEPEQAWIAQHPVIKYQVPQYAPPFIVENDDGTAMGIGVDLLSAIGQSTGLRFEPVRVQGGAPKSDGGRVDMLVAAAPNDAKLAGWEFSAPYSETPEVIVSRPENSYHGLASLRTINVAYGPSAATSVAALNDAGVKVLPARTEWAAADMVASGKAGAWVTNLATAYYVTQYRADLAIVGATGAPISDIVFAVRPGNAILARILDKGLASIPASRMHQLRDRWQLARQVRTAWDKRRSEILALVLGMVILTGLFVVWNHLLRKQIRRRKRAELELEAAMQVVEEANTAKSLFLATMSHEIRTPMNAVLGVLELLKETKGAIDSQLSSVDAAYQSAHALLSLIEDVLDLSKIESGKLQLAIQPTDCEALIRSIAKVFEGLARQRRIRFTVDIDNRHRLGARVDPIRLRQILSNLLSNAIKFTEAGAVALSAVITPGEHDHVYIELRVTDTGIGISPDEQARLFQPFSQADAAIAPRFGGSGLGLSICSRLVELMDGTLTLTSSPGVGTTVEVKVRAPHAELDDNETARYEPIGTLHRMFKARTALIVDDHPANRLVLSRQLEYLGFSVVSARDGADALDHMSSSDFDVVMTDCFMSGMTGWDLAREIRAKEASGRRRAVVIGCTASAQPETLSSALDAGLDLCVIKPLGLAVLAKRLSALLTSAGGDQCLPSTGASNEAQVLIEDLVDSSAIEQIVARDTQLEAKLLDTITKANRESLGVLQRAVESDDRLGFCGALHHMAGALRIIGASALVEVCRYAEQQSMDEGLPLRALLAGIAADVERLNDTLDRRVMALTVPEAGKQTADFS